MKFKLAYLSFVLLLMGGWNPSGVFAEDGGDPPVEEGGEIDEGVDEGVDEGIDEGAPAGGGDTDEGGMTLLDLLTAGGAVGYLILALSVIGLGLVFENFFSVRRSQLMPPEIIEELERYFQEEAYEEALELCDAEQNLLTNMIGAGLSKIAGGYDAITEAMDLIRTKKVDRDSLISHTFSLDRAKEAFEMQCNTDESIKVMITP